MQLIEIVYLRSNIISDFDITVGSGTLGVHNSLRDSLTSEVSKLVEEVEVLGEDGTTRTGGHGVLVVVNRGTSAGRNYGLLHYFS